MTIYSFIAVAVLFLGIGIEIGKHVTLQIHRRRPMTNKTYTLYTRDGVRVAQIDNSSVRAAVYNMVVDLARENEIYDRDDIINCDMFQIMASQLVTKMIETIFEV
jgi:hypothetical protein